MKYSIHKGMQYKHAALPGLFVFALLLIYAIIANMSFSYMGNTSKSVINFIVIHYKLLILWYFVKIFAVYALFGALLSIFFYYGVIYLYHYLNITFSKYTLYILSAILTFAIAFLQFCKSIILYPQLYLDTIYNKNIFYKHFQSMLTNYLSPLFFEILQTAILIPFVIVYLHAFYLMFINHQLIIKDVIVRSTKIALKGKTYIIFTFIVSGVGLALMFNHTNTIDKKPNVIILSADALRPDHFSGYGYKRNTTPHINAIIEEGTSFHNVYTVVPRTFPAWVSILTSQLPGKHGISHMFPMARTRNKDFITLPKILSQNGYYTAIVGDFAADIFPRIQLGYDTVKAPTFNMRVMIKQIILKNHIFLLPFLTNKVGFILFPEIREFAEFADPQFVVDDIKSEINKSIRANKPFFITTFFSITHFPYPACYPYYNYFTDSSYNGPFKYSKNRVVALDSKGVASEYQPSLHEIDYIRALYDGCLYAFDEAVGKVIQYLKEKNIFNNTIIIILSDHGENLYEYEYGMGHGEHLRGKYSLVIPCIFSGPGIPHGRFSTIRSAIDIAPTILDVVSIQQPPSFDGTSLFKSHNRIFDAYCETGIWFDNTGNFFFQKKRIMYPDITGISTIDFEYNDEITVTPYYEDLITIAKHRCIIANNTKLIYMPTHYGIEYELYDISKDPDERKNIYKISQQANIMKHKLFSILKHDGRLKLYNDYFIPVE